MPQDKDLPEGTDKIIGGASAPGPSQSSETLVAEPNLPTSAETQGTRDTGSRQGLRDRMRSGGEKLSGEAAGKARDLVGQGLERGGDALTNVGRLVGDTAGGLDDRLGQEYGDYARRAADAIERTAQSLRTKDPDELIDDTREFVRKSPGIALAGAAIVGFAIARLVKSGLDATQSDRRGRSGDLDDRGRGGGNV